MGAYALGELDVTTVHSKDDQMALPQDAFLGNGAGHAAGSTHGSFSPLIGLAEYHQQSCRGLFAAVFVG